MKLSEEQHALFERDGFLLIPHAFTDQEIASFHSALTSLDTDRPGRVLEADHQTLRSVYGPHEYNAAFRSLAHDPRLVGPAQQLLGTPVYLYQYKINTKAAFAGDKWEWHQDFIFWREEDGMPSPRVLNCALYLDDVTEFNGPMYVVPGSHKLGVVSVVALQDDATRKQEYDAHYADSPQWTANLTATLKYTIPQSTICRLVDSLGLRSTKGPAGTILIFHPNIVHASGMNMSPHNRSLVIGTYNSVDNKPAPRETQRPEFLASKDTSPISLA